jgi:hypothetical protein
METCFVLSKISPLPVHMQCLENEMIKIHDNGDNRCRSAVKMYVRLQYESAVMVAACM